MDNFKEDLNFCDLSIIPSKGQKFTWANNRKGAKFTKERPDRVVANLNAMILFPGSFYIVLPHLKSDHSPLLINITRSEYAVRQAYNLQVRSNMATQNESS